MHGDDRLSDEAGVRFDLSRLKVVETSDIPPFDESVGYARVSIGLWSRAVSLAINGSKP